MKVVCLRCGRKLHFFSYGKSIKFYKSFADQVYWILESVIFYTPYVTFRIKGYQTHQHWLKKNCFPNLFHFSTNSFNLVLPVPQESNLFFIKHTVVVLDRTKTFNHSCTESSLTSCTESFIIKLHWIFCKKVSKLIKFIPRQIHGTHTMLWHFQTPFSWKYGIVHSGSQLHNSYKCPNFVNR